MHYFPFSGNLKTAEYVELNVFSENADFLHENKKILNFCLENVETNQSYNDFGF